MHISPPSWVSLPPASHPSGSSQCTALSFPCYRAGSHHVSALHGSVHMGASPWLSGKDPTCRAGDTGSIPGSGRCLGGGQGNPFQYSYLQNHRDRGAWWAAVHTVAKSWARLKPLNTHAVYTCQSFSIRCLPPCPHCVHTTVLCIYSCPAHRLICNRAFKLECRANQWVIGVSYPVAAGMDRPTWSTEKYPEFGPDTAL